MSEVWKPIPGTDGRYEASSLGRICSLYGGGRQRKPRAAPKVLKPQPNEDGYLVVGLRRGGRRWCTTVNFAVCSAFHGPQPTHDHEAAHLDGTRSNNVPDNLQWATSKENNAHKEVHGTVRYRDRRAVDGVEHFRCTGCLEWLPRASFRREGGKSRCGASSRCVRCSRIAESLRKRRRRLAAA